MNTQLLSLKAKKFGVRLAGFRQKKGVSTEVLSMWTGIPQKQLEQIESGESTISLPLIELIALKLGILTDTLLFGKIESGDDALQNIGFITNFTRLRDRMIALTLKKARIDNNLSLTEIATQCGITEDQLAQYESGEDSIPWPTLERLCEIFQLPIDSLVSRLASDEKEPTTESPVSEKYPKELQEFLSNPANLPYLELAKRLSELDAAKLRSVAEGLLEITY